jgi:hypothetical protein
MRTHSQRFAIHFWHSIPIGFLWGHTCRFALDGYVEDRRRDDFPWAIKNTSAIDNSVLSEAQLNVLRHCHDMVALHADDGFQAKKEFETPKHTANFARTLGLIRRLPLRMSDKDVTATPARRASAA